MQFFAMQGYGSRSCVWDGESLILPSNSGKLLWWSVSGEKLFEVSAGSPDYIVRLAWSASGTALWMCGFSTLSYVEVEKDSTGTFGQQAFIVDMYTKYY